jgi:hypothetical protein
MRIFFSPPFLRPAVLTAGAFFLILAGVGRGRQPCPGLGTAASSSWFFLEFPYVW